jgi:hypothetical protein
MMMLGSAAAFVMPTAIRAPHLVVETPRATICACASPIVDIAKEQLLTTLNANEGLLLDTSLCESVEETVLDLSSRNPTETPARR